MTICCPNCGKLWEHPEDEGLSKPVFCNARCRDEYGMDVTEAYTLA